jgi:hypothetical protein
VERQKIEILNPNVKIQMSNEAQMAKEQAILLSSATKGTYFPLWNLEFL